MKHGMSSDSGEVANHASKRPRLDIVCPTNQGPLTNLKHDEQLWYPDGNIILVANGVGFRVYRGLLADRSEIFRGLFSVPQPPDGETVDGCPIVHVSESDIALREFLLVLLRGKRYIQKDDPELDTLSYRVRLAHKYGVTGLLEASVRKLKALYPHCLSEWKSKQLTFSPRAITAVNLAHLTETSTVLPAALYACCQLTDAALLDGAAHPDGSHDSLNQDDLAACMGAKVRFAQERMQRDYEWFSKGAESCSYNCDDPSRCTPIFGLIHRDALSQAWDTDVTSAIQPWTHLLEKYDSRNKFPRDALGKLCRACMDELDEVVNDHDIDMWERLPDTLEVLLDDPDAWNQADDSDAED